MSPNHLPKEILLPDSARRDKQGTKGDRVQSKTSSCVEPFGRPSLKNRKSKPDTRVLQLCTIHAYFFISLHKQTPVKIHCYWETISA
jgi:hypothetical protein